MQKSKRGKFRGKNQISSDIEMHHPLHFENEDGSKIKSTINLVLEI